ncbi:hypothetical protein NC99_05060 [Sunxiuqinia dokdonensis]|uniref:Uncharacterized protein n=1 Tax=Sunxiuqinia dokdonensis TaxID=1409788 RepID=A0A0L8VDZ7_9BACT|nr:hypothetical protein NC99_05060 [Sunxiuqinia dokdonensis]
MALDKMKTESIMKTDCLFQKKVGDLQIQKNHHQPFIYSENENS